MGLYDSFYFAEDNYTTEWQTTNLWNSMFRYYVDEDGQVWRHEHGEAFPVALTSDLHILQTSENGWSQDFIRFVDGKVVLRCKPSEVDFIWY